MRVWSERRRVLWKLFRSGQDVRCDVMPHPFGIEVSYLVNGKPVMSRVFEDWDSVEATSTGWRSGLLERGWHAREFVAAVSLAS
jgi:hypothetical protein